MNPRTPARSLLRPYAGRGLFVTATGTDVGKTVAAAALAGAFRRLHLRVGVCKPIATGCQMLPQHVTEKHQRLEPEDLQSADAAVLAHAAGLVATDRSLMHYLSPLRYAVPAAPAVAARVEERPPDWRRVESALDWWQENCEVLIVEGAGGWYVPLDDDDFMIADLATALRLPVLVVTQVALGTLNATMLTVHAIQSRNLPVAGLVLNRVPAADRRDFAQNSNLTELPRLTGVPVRAMLPELGEGAITDRVPESFIDALMPFAREWWGLTPPE